MPVVSALSGSKTSTLAKDKELVAVAYHIFSNELLKMTVGRAYKSKTLRRISHVTCSSNTPQYYIQQNNKCTLTSKSRRLEIYGVN